MKKLIKYNLEIMSVILLIFCLATALCRQDMALERKLTAGFMLVYILHEWEECRFPGGFHKLFFGRLGISSDRDTSTLHLPVAIAILILLIPGWMLGSSRILVLMPVCLSLFEGVIHTVGIRLMKMQHPYTPGMATAWLAFAYAVFSIHSLNAVRPLTVREWLAGILLTVVLFVVMQRCFIGLAGYSYRTLIPLARKNILGDL